MLFSRRQWAAALIGAALLHIGLAFLALWLRPHSSGLPGSEPGVMVSLQSLEAPEVPLTTPTPAPAVPVAPSPEPVTPLSPQPVPAQSAQLIPDPAAPTAPAAPEIPEPVTPVPAATATPEVPATSVIAKAVTVRPENVVQAVTPEQPQATAQPQPGANLTASYVGRLRSWLASNRRYPPEARQQGLEGTVRLYFVVDRDGRVLEYRILGSTGHRILDQEVRALIERAQPLPAMPADLMRNRLEIIVPVEFSLR